MINIIPRPLFWQEKEGAGFTLHNGCTLKDKTETKGIFDDLFFFLGEKFGYVPIGGDADGIYLSFSDEIKDGEGYTLICENGIINITASQPAGLFYGLQTVKQLLNAGNGKIEPLIIMDKPLYRQRGFMLDVSRHFFTVDCVKLFIDVLAIHKLNRLHLHLTDDQGWRFESDNYPLLTAIGSERAYTAFDRVQHRGFFSKDDIRNLTEYAKSKYIRIVPELDIPGHCSAAICAMPNLSCFENEVEVCTHFGTKKNILCLGKATTVEFVKKIVAEAVRDFDCDEIHLGCNDVSYDSMKICPRCQKKIRDNALENEAQLVEFFIEEIKVAFPHIRFTVWKNGGQENDSGFIDSGAPLVLSSTYGENSLKHCYEYSPRKNAVGTEALLFSEYIPSIEKAGYLMLPRLCAASEISWSSEKDYNTFSAALPGIFDLLKLYSMPHADLKQAMPSFFRKVGYGVFNRAIKTISENEK